MSRNQNEDSCEQRDHHRSFNRPGAFCLSVIKCFRDFFAIPFGKRSFVCQLQKIELTRLYLSRGWQINAQHANRGQLLYVYFLFAL